MEDKNGVLLISLCESRYVVDIENDMYIQRGMEGKFRELLDNLSRGERNELIHQINRLADDAMRNKNNADDVLVCNLSIYGEVFTARATPRLARTI